MPRGRLERGALWGMTGLALLWSARLNLRAGPVTWDEDETSYFRLASVLGRAIYGLAPGQAVVDLVSTYRPPLTVLADAVTLLALPFAPGLLALSRVVWVAMLLWSVGGLARDLAERWGHDEAARDRAAALAVVLTGTAPALLQLGASLMSEVPLAALFVLALRLLLRTGAERRPRDAWLLGVVIGLGLLVKWTLPVSLAAPLVLAVVVAHRRAEIPGLAIRAAFAAALVAGPWYVAAGRRVTAFITEVGTGAGAQAFGAGQRTALEEIGYYPLALAGGLIWWPLAGLALWGCWRAARDRMVGSAVLIAAVLGPVLLFSFPANKEIRYLLPSLGVLAALGAAGIRPRARTLAIALCLGLLGCVGGLWSQGHEPSIVRSSQVGPLTVLRGDGERVPLALSLSTPLGPLSLWARQSEAFPYRRPLWESVPIAAIDDAVQRTNPGGGRDAAVVSPEPWLWTPLWARAMRARGWTTWRSAACDPLIVSEAAFFLEVDPPGQMLHCKELSRRSQAEFDGLRSQLQPLDRWTMDGRLLTLWVHRGRLYPAGTTPPEH